MRYFSLEGNESLLVREDRKEVVETAPVWAEGVPARGNPRMGVFRDKFGSYEGPIGVSATILDSWHVGEWEALSHPWETVPPRTGIIAFEATISADTGTRTRPHISQEDVVGAVRVNRWFEIVGGRARLSPSYEVLWVAMKDATQDAANGRRTSWNTWVDGGQARAALAVLTVAAEGRPYTCEEELVEGVVRRHSPTSLISYSESSVYWIRMAKMEGI